MSVIDEIKARESGGYVVVPKAPGWKRSSNVRVVRGAFTDQFAVFEGMRPRERVEVLLMLFGGQQRVELPKADVRLV
jgi:transcriptional antiterminator RfaH